MKQIRKVLGILAVLAILIYVAWQVANNLTEQIRTVDAMEITVEDKIPVRGWFIRQQTLVEGRDGAAEYLLPDGEKAARGERLAVFFSDESARQAYAQTQALQSRLDALEYAYSLITGGTDSLKLDQRIADQIAALDGSLSAGETRGVAEGYAALQQLVASRGSTGADKERFEERIAALQQEIAAGRSSYASASSYVKAPESGYFISGADGYETVLTTELLDTLTPEKLDALQPDPASTGVGSIVTGYRWYFAAVLEKEQAAALQQRETVQLYFPELSRRLLTMRLYRLQSGDDGRAILILESDEMLPDYLTCRQQDADLLAGTYTGLKVPAQALRQKDGQWGVYVLDGSVAEFKPIQWIYQTESYYLVPSAESAKKGLYRYDRMITQGKDLADEKVIQ